MIIATATLRMTTSIRVWEMEVRAGLSLLLQGRMEVY